MINYGGSKKKKTAKKVRPKSSKRKSHKIKKKSNSQFMDVIYKGKKIKTIREYSFDNERPAKRTRKRSLQRKLRSLDVSFSSYKSRKSNFKKVRRQRSRSNK
jgi:hypothetical protein